jgi:hypothetical protein
MARGVRTNATLLPTFSPSLQPQSIASYDAKTRRNTILIAEIVPTLHDAGARSLTIPADRFYGAIGSASSASHLPEWMAANSGTLTFGNWDATDKRHYIQLDAGGLIGSPASFPKFIYHSGPFGDSTGHAPKNTSVSACSIKFRARFPTNADYTTLGIGASTTTVFTTATDHFFQVLRNTAAWELGTADGATLSQSSGGTANGNFHDFEVLWSTADLKLYVDSVLTITKSTNMPARPLGVLGVNNADNIDIVDYLVEWIT